MKVLYDWKGIRNQFKDIVVALGNFDGVHVGHQRLISSLVTEAKNINGTSVVFTFQPHPLQVLLGEAPMILISQQTKEDIFREMGVDVLLLIPFTEKFAHLSPEKFIEKILVDGLDVKSIFVGYNYTFGRNGSGTAKTLENEGSRYGFKVNIIQPVAVTDIPVSSTLIRNLLNKGEVDEAARYLGGNFFIEGQVREGEKRGRQLGFPTANIMIREGFMAPANGIYAVKVQSDGEIYSGVANLGIKPTFCQKKTTPILEVHLLDFKGDLYGKTIKVYFIKKIREEKKFSSVDKLIVEIKSDVEKSRIILSKAFTDN
ncbi:MAG: bifunctional riboflavin kinase/FAD synthetase [Peptococcaceae bacterium]|nr:bifunctional riboflavin kinase/FAD synthetase [Peptococcaceae bacterium]